MEYQLKHNMGTDPEVFIHDVNVNFESLKLSSIVPPAALHEDFGVKFEEVGNKKVYLSGKDFQWSEDGAAIELQIVPAKSIDAFIDGIKTAYLALQNFFKRGAFPGSGYETLYPVTDSTVFFDLDKYWKDRGDSFRSCVRFGCDPDRFPMLYSDLGLDERGVDEIDVTNHSFRYGGGHIHIQADDTNPEVYFPIWQHAATVFDFFPGLINAAATRDPKQRSLDLMRLKYYGNPGRIRLQVYDQTLPVCGLEYRVMSNYWLNDLVSSNFRKNIVKSLLVACDVAATLCETQGMAELFVHDFMDKIPTMYTAIKTLDVATSKELLQQATSWGISHGVVSIEEGSCFSGNSSYGYDY